MATFMKCHHMSPDHATALLRRYGLTPADLIGQGMEASVYAYGPVKVLKLYDATTTLEHLERLQAFYDGVDTSGLPYSLPQIYEITPVEDAVIVIEKRLHGRPLSSLLPQLSGAGLDRAMRTYLAATLALQTIKPLSMPEHYKLFDQEGSSTVTDGNWHAFLGTYIRQQVEQVGSYLVHDVSDWTAKVERLLASLKHPYHGPYHLAHGDIFPGNVLVDDQLQVTALLDWGLMTMWGDPLWDVATGWAFFDMYDALRMDLRRRYLQVVLANFGEHVRSKLYHYVLIYSIVSANAYSSQCADGHYQWCVQNLNTAEYWNGRS